MEYTVAELEQERWKPIFGYDGMYEVSDLGRVRSKYSGEWKVLMFDMDRNGYLKVGLSKYGKVKHFLVHRLVAQAFIENDNIFNTEINHINEIKSDDRVSNLEYCDRSYNVSYNGLQQRRYHPKQFNCKRRKLKDLYRPDLSIDDNIKLFKSNGIECSRNTVKRLRKDLGLERPQPKRNKVKDLYDPNLTYEQNIEIFKANGVECSKRVIQSIRQDLGLTKKYNRNQ